MSPIAQPYAKLLSCSVRSPHQSWTVVDTGELSVLYSYGEPFGFALSELILTRAGSSHTTKRHLNQWRDYRLQKELPTQDFHAALLSAMHLTLSKLISAVDPDQTGVSIMMLHAPTLAIEEPEVEVDEQETEADEYLDDDELEDEDEDEDEWDDEDDVDEEELDGLSEDDED